MLLPCFRHTLSERFVVKSREVGGVFSATGRACGIPPPTWRRSTDQPLCQTHVEDYRRRWELGLAGRDPETKRPRRPHVPRRRVRSAAHPKSVLIILLLDIRMGVVQYELIGPGVSLREGHPAETSETAVQWEQRVLWPQRRQWGSPPCRTLRVFLPLFPWNEIQAQRTPL